MVENMRWGILSTGNIAKQFARGLAVVDDAQLVAVGSRSQASADEFGDEFDVPRRHASYEALANDPEIDVIYIGTPHPFHKENALMCINAGKAVLVEKPFTINAKQTQSVIDAARSKGVFVMEAMWTRFVPAMAKVRELVAQGIIGDIRMMNAEFCFRTGAGPEHRLLNPELGGGSLLDVGIYPVALSYMLFGPPRKIATLATIGETGVDEQSAAIFQYDDGEIALMSSSVRTPSLMEAVIQGTDGIIKLHQNWWQLQRFTVHKGDKTEDYEFPFKGNGYEYEAMEVASCIRTGKTESDIMPLDETLQMMQTLDEIRAQWGLTYPME